MKYAYLHSAAVLGDARDDDVLEPLVDRKRRDREARRVGRSNLQKRQAQHALLRVRAFDADVHRLADAQNPIRVLDEFRRAHVAAVDEAVDLRADGDPRAVRLQRADDARKPLACARGNRSRG